MKKRWSFFGAKTFLCGLVLHFAATSGFSSTRNSVEATLFDVALFCFRRGADASQTRSFSLTNYTHSARFSIRFLPLGIVLLVCDIVVLWARYYGALFYALNAN